MCMVILDDFGRRKKSDNASWYAVMIKNIIFVWKHISFANEVILSEWLY